MRVANGCSVIWWWSFVTNFCSNLSLSRLGVHCSLFRSLCVGLKVLVSLKQMNNANRWVSRGQTSYISQTFHLSRKLINFSYWLYSRWIKGIGEEEQRKSGRSYIYIFIMHNSHKKLSKVDEDEFHAMSRKNEMNWMSLAGFESHLMAHPVCVCVCFRAMW